MTQNIPLNSGDVAIEPFFDATQELLGAASPSFRVFIQSATVLRVTADSGNDQQSIAINGRYRFRTTPVDATHPGGGAGTHAVYVTASNNSFTLGGSTTDNTVYAFGLEIKTSGTPTAVDQYRKVADVDWDGAQITALRQFVGGRFDGDPGVFVAPLATITPLQVKAASSQSADVAKIVSSSDSVLFRISSSGAATFADAVSLPNAGLTVGDTNLYRSAADVLKTDDAFHAIEGFSAPGMTASTSEALKASVFGDTQNRLSVQASGEMTWGSGTAAGDTNLYRSAANTLRTDDALYVSGGITVPGGITGLANNAVDTAHITNGSVTSAKILDGTIVNADIADGTITNAKLASTLVTSLPGSPTDGQEIYYQADSSNGIIWHLRFRSVASGGDVTYGWEYV